MRQPEAAHSSPAFPHPKWQAAPSPITYPRLKHHIKHFSLQTPYPQLDAPSPVVFLPRPPPRQGHRAGPSRKWYRKPHTLAADIVGHLGCQPKQNRLDAVHELPSHCHFDRLYSHDTRAGESVQRLYPAYSRRRVPEAGLFSEEESVRLCV